VISSWGCHKKLPNVYTEHGVFMLFSILNSKQEVRQDRFISFAMTRKLIFFLAESRRLKAESFNHSIKNQSSF
jgi:hypothetical protein